MRIGWFMTCMLAMMLSLQAQEKQVAEKWYEQLSLGGYMQVRYNGLFETNPDLYCEQCDENWGSGGGGLSFRRIRFKIKGQITPHIFVYFQPDFAKSVGEEHFVGRVKDAYVDVGVDEASEFRFRIGQSKVPYGYENMQSSSHRIPLDRDDAINSGMKDERDLGVFFYWATQKQRRLWKQLRKAGLSGGDFGMFAFGLYNGQTANHYDQNKEFHLVTRFTYPITVGNQVIEPGIQAYSGKYVVTEHGSTIEVNPDGYVDQRVGASFVLYPQPFGIQAEYNIGKGPEYDVATQSIEVKPLQGGYITCSYYIHKWGQDFYPFIRYQYYDGGKKHELDARSYAVHDTEVGVEWHPFKHFELVTEYTFSDRRFEDDVNPFNHQKGSLMRIQAQVKF